MTVTPNGMLIPLREKLFQNVAFKALAGSQVLAGGDLDPALFITASSTKCCALIRELSNITGATCGGALSGRVDQDIQFDITIVSEDFWYGKQVAQKAEDLILGDFMMSYEGIDYWMMIPRITRSHVFDEAGYHREILTFRGKNWRWQSTTLPLKE